MILKRIAFMVALVLVVGSARAQTGWTNLYTMANGAYATAVAVDTNGNVLVTGQAYDASDNAYYATIKYSNAGLSLWTNLYTMARGAYAYDIAVDTTGNVFASGYAFDASNNAYYATIKYSNAGVPLWTNLYTMSGGAEAIAIAVDTNGNVSVTGKAFDASANEYYATIQYSSAGVLLWTNLYTMAGGAYANAIAVDNSGNVLVTGAATDASANEYYATIKYSNAGMPLWTNLYTGAGTNATGNAIAVDSTGNAFATGEAYDESGNTSYATIKYSNAGMPLWTNLYKMANGATATAIAIDANGNVFVTGNSIDASDNAYYATIKYSNAGLPLWTNLYTMAGGAYAYAIAVDNNGNVFASGYAVDGSNNAYYATIKYSNAGMPLWTNLYTMADGAYAYAVAVDNNGNAFVTGYAVDASDNANYATIKYPNVSTPLSPYLGIRWLNNQAVLSWTNAGFNLQTTPTVTGSFTNIPGATSPYTNRVTGGQQFFRLAQ